MPTNAIVYQHLQELIVRQPSIAAVILVKTMAHVLIRMEDIPATVLHSLQEQIATHVSIAIVHHVEMVGHA